MIKKKHLKIQNLKKINNNILDKISLMSKKNNIYFNLKNKTKNKQIK